MKKFLDYSGLTTYNTHVLSLLSGATSQIQALSGEIIDDEYVVSKHINALNERISANTVDISAISGVASSKQDILTAGDNITISGNVISAVDTIYNDSVVKEAISANTNAISAHGTAISANTQAVEAHGAAISGHDTTLAAHGTAISGNSADILTLSGIIIDDEFVLAKQINALGTAISGQSADIAGVSGAVATKQNVLTAGTNITISGDVISATDTIYDDSVVKQSISANMDTLAAHAATLTAHGVAISGNSDDILTLSGAIITEASARTAADATLQDEIDNLKARGRFLALWNAVSGKPETEPQTLPYAYNTGDYYIVSVTGATNYMPNGSGYTGAASTTVESNELAVDDVYYYDGSNWKLQKNSQKTLSFANITGSPYDNTNLKNALDAKQGVLTAGANITISGSEISATDTVYDDSVVKQSISANSADILFLSGAIIDDEYVTSKHINALNENKQNKLVAGTGILISGVSGNEISCTVSAETYDDTELRNAISGNMRSISAQGTEISAHTTTLTAHGTAISANTQAVEAHGTAISANTATIAAHGVAISGNSDNIILLSGAIIDDELVISRHLNALDTNKQDKLVAGTGIQISGVSGNEISCTVEAYDDTLVKTAISANMASIAAQGTEISAHTTTLTAHGTAISGHDATLIAHGTGISANTTNIAALSASVENLSGIIIDDEYVISKHINDLGTNKQDKLVAGTGILISGVSGNEISCTVSGYNDTEIRNAISANMQSISAQGTEISAHTTTLTAHGTEISAHTTTLSAHGTAISANTDNITALSASVESESQTISLHINSLYDSKQDNLSAGTGINIVDNVISCTVSGSSYDDTELRNAISGNMQSISAQGTAISANTANITAHGTAISANTDNILLLSGALIDDELVLARHINALNSGITINAAAISTEASARTAADATLQTEIDNLKARGRFLALWNAVSGKPETDPQTLPYSYNTGDYYIVSVTGATNYMPNGSGYTGAASTTVESNELAVDDVYYYDGSNWKLQKNSQKVLSFANITGSPYDNTNLKNALDAKQATLTAGANITISGTEISAIDTVYNDSVVKAAISANSENILFLSGAIIDDELVISRHLNALDTNKQDTLVAGTGILISGVSGNEISCTVSAYDDTVVKTAISANMESISAQSATISAHTSSIATLSSGKLDITAASATYRTIADAETAEQVAADAINALDENKQDVLTAGDGIQISGNVVTCTATSGINANALAIAALSAVVDDDGLVVSRHINALYSTKQNTLVAGTGISITGVSGNVISCTVSAETYDDTELRNAISGNMQSISAQGSAISGHGETLTAHGTAISANMEDISANTMAIEALSAAVDDGEFVITKHILALSGEVVNKQDVLTAGSGITISGNVISCTVSAETYDDTELRNAISGNMRSISAQGTAISANSDNILFLSGAIISDELVISKHINELGDELSGLSATVVTVSSEVAGKQDALTAGTNIVISGNVISVSGVVTDVYTKTEIDNAECAISMAIANLETSKQDVLTAGVGIDISDGKISVTNPSGQTYDDTYLRGQVSSLNTSVSSLNTAVSGIQSGYLPKSGGTMTGAISFNGNGSIDDGQQDELVITTTDLTIDCTRINNSGDLLMDSGSTMYTGQILPDATNNSNIGAATRRYKDVYAYTFHAGTAVYQDSDERLKNIHGEIDLERAYDLIDKCSTIIYDMKEDETHKEQVGVIAQEIQEFFPEIVCENEEGMLSVDYSRLTVIIMRVLKDLIERIKKLEN